MPEEIVWASVEMPEGLSECPYVYRETSQKAIMDVCIVCLKGSRDACLGPIWMSKCLSECLDVWTPV